jgi:hypothetical protein
MAAPAKELRRQIKMSITAAAAMAGCSPNSWRLYEANREAVTLEIRLTCDAAVARMEQLARERHAA